MAGGRPTKLTPAVQQTIVGAIKAGNYMETAAAMAGISKDTLYAWLRRGARARQGLYREFSDAVLQASASAEARDVALIGMAAKTQWQAAAWRLERKHPDRWGRRDRMLVQSLVGEEIEAFLRRLEESLPADQYARVLEIAAGE